MSDLTDQINELFETPEEVEQEPIVEEVVEESRPKTKREHTLIDISSLFDEDAPEPTEDLVEVVLPEEPKKKEYVYKKLNTLSVKKNTRDLREQTKRAEFNLDIDSLFESISDDEEEVISEELGIPVEKPASKSKLVNNLSLEHKQVIREETAPNVDIQPEPKRQLKETKQPVSPNNHINELAAGMGKIIASEDKKTRRAYDNLQNLTEEERRDKKIEILENRVSQIAMMTKAHFPGEGGKNLVSGIGQGGDGQTPGGGAVWLWDLDDVEIGTPLNGEYPSIGNGSVLVFNSTLDKWVAGVGGSGGTITTAQLQLANPVTDDNVDVGDLPAPGTLTTQQGVNQWIAQSLLYIDDKISGGTDNDMEFDGDIEFIGSSTQSLVKYNGGDLDIKVSGTDKASAVIVGQFTTTGLTLPSKTLAAQAVNSTTGAFSGAVTIHTLTTGAEAGVAINAAAGQVTAQWMNVGTNPETDTSDSNYGVSIRTSGKFISPETNVTILSGSRQGVVYKLVAGDGVAFDGQASTHIGGTVGNDYNTNVGTLKVNATVIRTTGDQQITGTTTLQNALVVTPKAVPFTDAYNSLKILGYVDSSKTNTLLKSYIRQSSSTQQDYIEYFGDTAGNNMIVNRAAVQTMIDNGGGSGLNFKGSVNLTTDNAPASPNGGDLYINDTAGTVKADANPAWTGIAGNTCSAGQQVIYNSSASEWVLGVVEDDSSFVKVDGTNDMTGSLIIDIPTSTSDTVAFKIEKNNVDKITLNTTGTATFNGAVTTTGLLPSASANNIGATGNRWNTGFFNIVDCTGSLTVDGGPINFDSMSVNSGGTGNIGTTSARIGTLHGTTVNTTNITSNGGTIGLGTNTSYATVNIAGPITIDTGAVNASDPPAGVPLFTKKRPTQEGYSDFIIQGTTIDSPTDFTGNLLQVFRNDYSNTGEVDAINYQGRTSAEDNIQTKKSVEALIAGQGSAANLTQGGVIQKGGGSTNTSGNLAIVASNGTTGEGRLYIQQEVADGGGTSTVTNISLFPTGSIVIGESHTMGRASALTGDKSYKHIIGNSNNVRFQAGADTETGSQVTFLNFKNSGTPSARATYVNGRFAIGEGANSFNINNSVISIDGYDTAGGTAGDIRYTDCANVKTLYLGGVTTGRGFRIKTGIAADAGNVVFRPNESGSSGTTSSANYLGMNIRMFAAGNTSESTTPNIKLTGADGSIVAKEYDFVSEGVFKTPYGFKLLNGSSATEAISLDTALNLTLTLQSGPSINGNRLTWNTASKSTGQVDIYATGNATKNNFNFQGGLNVAGATGSVSIMELERDTSFASNSQKIVTIHGGIIMDGVGATTNNNAYRTENAITFNNGTANGVGMIHKIGNTGADGNYVHIAGKTNADGTNGALSGKYTVVKIGRDASNKMDAQFAWNDTTDGVTPGTQTIWNQKVAQSFGVVTSLSATYGASASDADNYQFNAVTSWNRPIADDANGTGFEIKGATAAAPTNTSAKLVEVYHDVNNVGTGDSLNYYGKTSANDNVQTKSSVTSLGDGRYSQLGATNIFTEENTFTKDMNFGANCERFDFTYPGTVVFSNDQGTNNSWYFLGNNASGSYGAAFLISFEGNRVMAPVTIEKSCSFTTEVPTCSTAPTSNTHLANKAYVDSHANSVTGGQTSGTFTITFDGTGTVPSTKVTTTAHYVKTGKMVFIHFTASNLNFTGYAGGGIRMTGLPFAPDTTIGEQVGTIHSVNFKVNNYHADDGHVVVVNKDATYGNFLQILSEQVSQETTYITNTTATKIRVSINYITSD